MNILSISPAAHDDSATLIANNKVFAIEFERLSRIKHNCNQDVLTEAYINNALNETLYKSRLKEDQKDLINKATKYLINAADIKMEEVDILSDTSLTANIPVKTDYGHHNNHAASTFYPSYFKKAAILVVDLFGNSHPQNTDLKETVSFWLGENKNIKNLKIYYTPAYQLNGALSKKYDYHNSIGIFYMDLTLFCGFKGLEGGKTMGLSPYGTDKFVQKLKRFIKTDQKTGTITFQRKYNQFLEKERKKNQDIFQFKADVAFAAQKILEEIILFYCYSLYEMTECDSICLAGGIALNSVANGIITEKTPFKKIFIQPASNDSGISLGKALNIFYQFKENLKTELDFRNFYLGKEYTSADIKRAIEDTNNINVKKFNNYDELCEYVAGLLKDNKIIAWFQGASEFGPRALGNRSILCNPFTKQMKNILNKRIKFREWFRPFAPIVMEEQAQHFFYNKLPCPYMLQVKTVKSDKIPAVTHKDNTARLQTINRKQNEKIYILLEKFYNKTDVPVLLNTSFNIKGEPIVESPEDAIRTFCCSNMDNLVIGEYLLSK